MTEKNKIDKIHDKLILQAKKLALVELQIKIKEQIEKVVRFHQPQEDVDTIRSMIKKYSSSGGELYHDNCFNVQKDITKVDDEGREYIAQD